MRRMLLAGLMLHRRRSLALRRRKRTRAPLAGLQDNSFLIEEAYNRKPASFSTSAACAARTAPGRLPTPRSGRSEPRRISSPTRVPYLWLHGDGGRGFRRRHAELPLSGADRECEPASLRAALQLILPTGDEDRGTGVGSYGYQINLPVSKSCLTALRLHGNAGVTSYFDVHGRQPTSYNLGGSIVYAVTRDKASFPVKRLGESSQIRSGIVGGVGGFGPSRFCRDVRQPSI